MIILDDGYFMMIEPKQDCQEPIYDDITSSAELLEKVLVQKNSYRGWHKANCGRQSDNHDWICPNGMITNSLMLHYITYHRNEVPESEIKKLERMYNKGI